MEELWLFHDPENVAVITTHNIMTKISPVLYVSHDEEDGMWQFLDGGNVREEDARVFGLNEIINIDPSLVQLADLPLGWVAWRETIDHKWLRARR